MRFDKLTTKFQQALADAQSIAVGHDNAYIEPLHALLALLNQDDGATASLLGRAGANVAPLKAALDTWGEISFNYASTDTSDYALTPSTSN